MLRQAAVKSGQNTTCMWFNSGHHLRMKKPTTPSVAHPEKAGSSSIPSRPSRVRIPEKWQPYYRKLQELHDNLLSQNGNLLRDAREPVGTAGTHVAESGTDEFDRSLHFSLLATEQNALHEVEAAMRRIENGSYGACEITGAKIPAARLKAIPWTRYTAPVEAEFERARQTGAPPPTNRIRKAPGNADAALPPKRARVRPRNTRPKR
jgi:RNA polymerase-binding transcription factor DksA